MLAVNLLLQPDVKPSEFVLCTFTEKAALEIRERITHIAREVNLSKDVYQMRIDTIHDVCRQIIAEQLHETELANGYETLDQFPQKLFIYKHLNNICTPEALLKFRDKWISNWEITQQLQFYFNRIVDALLFNRLIQNLRTRNTQKLSDQQRLLNHLVESSSDQIVTKIHSKEFTAKPQPMLCSHCDLKSIRVKDRTLTTC